MIPELTSANMPAWRPFAMLHRGLPYVSTPPVFAGAGGCTPREKSPFTFKGLVPRRMAVPARMDLPEKR